MIFTRHRSDVKQTDPRTESIIRRFVLLSGLMLVAPALELHAQTGGSDAFETDWVALEGACFEMGDNRTYPEEAPQHTVCVAPFEIARTEVTNAQFSAFVEATGYVTHAEKGDGIELPPGGAVFHPLEGSRPADLNWWRWVEDASWKQPAGSDNPQPEPNHPVTQITQADAEAYAEWAGGRLPTEAEWEYAARGGLDGELLAWPEAERAAAHEKANTWQGVFPVVDTSADGFAGVAPVGSFPPNGFGLHDMVGNVWEWTSTPYSPSHAERDRALAGVTGFDMTQPGIAVGTIKGGSYLCATSYCYRFRPAARQAQDLGYGTSHIGFRIARSDD